MAAIAYALTASAFWGVADFFGGLNSRRLPVITVLLWVEGSGIFFVGLVILITGEGPPGTSAVPPGAGALQLAGTGCLDLLATGLYGLANTHGLLSIVSVVGSLYPLSTIALARWRLDERIRPLQASGIAAALGGVALIAAG